MSARPGEGETASAHHDGVERPRDAVRRIHCGVGETAEVEASGRHGSRLGIFHRDVGETVSGHRGAEARASGRQTVAEEVTAICRALRAGAGATASGRTCAEAG